MPSFRVNNRGHIFFTDQSGKVSLRSYSMSRLRDSCGRLFQSTSRSAYSGNRIMTIDGAMSIKRGDRIFTEKPFVFALKSVYRKERCDFCLKHNKVMKCSNCKTVYYCNEACQMEAWSMHKVECPMLKKIYPRVVPDAARMLLRLIIRLDQGGDFVRGYYTRTEFRKFRDLMSHYYDIKNDPKRVEHLESLFAVIGDILEGSSISLPNKSTLLATYGRFITNGFNVLDCEMNSIATAIYLGVSVIDHSCEPNAVATFVGTTLNIHALEDISNLEWSKIRISYIDVLNTSEGRRRDLQSNYYFWCDCVRCQNTSEDMEMNAAKCPNKKCKAFVDISNNNCQRCRATISTEHRSLFLEAVKFTKENLEKMGETSYLDICNHCLKKQKSTVHPLNFWHVKTLDVAFEACITVKKWSEAIEFGKQLIPGFLKYFGEWNPLLGILYLKLGKLQLNAELFEDSAKNLKQAEKILKVTHGIDHPIMNEHLRPMMMQAIRARQILTTLSNISEMYSMT